MYIYNFKVLHMSKLMRSLAGSSLWALIYTCSCYILLDVPLMNSARVKAFLLFWGRRVVWCSLDIKGKYCRISKCATFGRIPHYSNWANASLSPDWLGLDWIPRSRWPWTSRLYRRYHPWLIIGRNFDHVYVWADEFPVSMQWSSSQVVDGIKIKSLLKNIPCTSDAHSLSQPNDMNCDPWWGNTPSPPVRLSWVLRHLLFVHRHFPPMLTIHASESRI